jgi:hypothetical protein
VLKYTCLESYGIYTQKPGSTSIRGQKLSRTHCNSWCIYVPLFTDLKQAKINLFDWPLVKYTYKHRMKCTLSIWNGVPYWSFINITKLMVIILPAFDLLLSKELLFLFPRHERASFPIYILIASVHREKTHWMKLINTEHHFILTMYISSCVCMYNL